MDCGPTCLRMIAKFHGRSFKTQTLRQYCEIDREGVSLLGISDAAEKIGFRTLGAKLSVSELREVDLPCILHWRQSHFVVLYRINKDKFYIADPGKGLVVLSESEFSQNWLTVDDLKSGISLILNPTPAFFAQENETDSTVKWSFLFRYFVVYKKLVLQLILGLAVGTVMQLIAPFLAQSIVDIGVNTHDLNFIYLVLIAQAALIIGRVSVEFIRSWILLHMSTRVNIAILTDFLIKLMKLPIGFFDTKMTGDIMQRMNDQKRIETFLTGSTLNTLFSGFNLIVFSFVLVWYNGLIFLVFSISSIAYTCWIFLFLKRRRDLDYKNYQFAAKNQSNVVQLVTGMQEIKLNNCEQQKRWEWEHIQARLFKYKIKGLALSQYQQGGSTLINEGTNLLITFLSAQAVINGDLTIGGMLAVQFIIGQLNSPVQQFLSFIQGYQDAKISLERLNEIHQLDDEEAAEKEWSYTLPTNKTLSLNSLTFRYPGVGNTPVLKGINLQIPEGKTTAIVGMSGSGKTTILKLLLRFYEPDRGDIRVGDQAISGISFKSWRERCGVVMQEGFIFSDSISRNIAVGDEYPDKIKLQHAINIANLSDFIDSLPIGLNTKIGSEGNGISQGQKQRILIARAVYKNPDYIFFDEATNALDATNEKVIMGNLEKFFEGRTVIIVAHRLSTVKHADNIILLERGRIIEQGRHSELTAIKGKYYQLVKNQLELDS